MSATPTPEHVQSVEETLEKTDFGHIINENKKAILIIGGIIVALIVAYSAFDHVKSNKYKESLDDTFKVESSVFISFLDGKNDAKAFLANLKGVDAKYIGHANLVPSLLLALNKVQEDGSMSNEYLELAMTWLNKIDKRSELYLLAGLRVSALSEDLGSTDKSIEILEDIKGKKFSILEDRVHFELGRLYLAKGNKDKAAANLKVVIDYKGESELKNMAKIYLSEI